MGRNPIKENQNPYFRARKQAAEWDARLESRERASELIGIAAYTLADYELGNVKKSASRQGFDNGGSVQCTLAPEQLLQE